jgi:hypothetical protein
VSAFFNGAAGLGASVVPRWCLGLPFAASHTLQARIRAAPSHTERGAHRAQSNAGEDALAGPYLLAISAHEYIDAAASNTNPTRYINDGCSADLNNARLECRTDGTVYVTMTAACRPGEEILMSYGDEYWAHSVESDVDALRMQASCISLDDEEEKVDVAPFPRHMYASPTAALEDPLALTPA